MVTNFRAEKLMKRIFDNGKCVYTSPSAEQIKQFCAEQIDMLWDELKRFEYPHKYYVDLSPKLWKKKNELLEKAMAL